MFDMHVVPGYRGDDLEEQEDLEEKLPEFAIFRWPQTGQIYYDGDLLWETDNMQAEEDIFEDLVHLARRWEAKGIVRVKEMEREGGIK